MDCTVQYGPLEQFPGGAGGHRRSGGGRRQRRWRPYNSPIWASRLAHGSRKKYPVRGIPQIDELGMCMLHTCAFAHDLSSENFEKTSKIQQKYT